MVIVLSTKIYTTKKSYNIYIKSHNMNTCILPEFLYGSTDMECNKTRQKSIQICQRKIENENGNPRHGTYYIIT